MVSPNHSQRTRVTGDGPSAAAAGTAENTSATWPTVTIHETVSLRRSSHRRSDGPDINRLAPGRPAGGP